MIRAVTLRAWWAAALRRQPRRQARRQLRVQRLVVVDDDGQALITLGSHDGAAVLHVGRSANSSDESTAAVVIVAYPPIDDDPPIAGISLATDGTVAQTWEVRGANAAGDG